MIWGAAAFALNLLSIASLYFWIAVAAVSVAFHLMRFVKGAHSASTRCYLLWLGVFSPWLAAICASFVLLAPLHGTGENAFLNAILHWHHPWSFDLFSWHSLPLIAWVGVGLNSTRMGIRNYRQHRRTTCLLDTLCTVDARGLRLLSTSDRHAFTAGFLSPQVYVTEGLTEILGRDELQIVLLHEQAHAKHRDPLKKWLFSMLAGFMPSSVRRQQVRAMSLAMEQRADEAVLQQVPDRRSLAGRLLALIKIIDTRNDPAPANSCQFGGNSFQARLIYLIEGESHQSFPWVSLCVWGITLITVCLFSADTLHHLIEYIANH